MVRGNTTTTDLPYVIVGGNCTTTGIIVIIMQSGPPSISVFRAGSLFVYVLSTGFRSLFLLFDSVILQVFLFLWFSSGQTHAPTLSKRWFLFLLSAAFSLFSLFSAVFCLMEFGFGTKQATLSHRSPLFETHSSQK